MIFVRVISWQDLLKLLEDGAVQIAAPKRHFSKDIVMDKDTPFPPFEATQMAE